MPIPVFDKLIQIGNLIIHHSHKIYTYKNRFFCSCCGSNVNVKMKKLKDPCSNLRTKVGQDFLAQLYSDKIKTTRNNSSFSNCLDNIQNNLNSIALQQEEEVAIPSSPDFEGPEELSEDCQSPLCCPGSSDSD